MFCNGAAPRDGGRFLVSFTGGEEREENAVSGCAAVVRRENA